MALNLTVTVLIVFYFIIGMSVEEVFPFILAIWIGWLVFGVSGEYHKQNNEYK